MRCLASIVALIASAFAAPAEPNTPAPLVWHVKLLAEPAAQFPPEFRTRLVKDIKMALETGLGPSLCRVEFADLTSAESSDPLDRAFHDRGWSALPPSDSQPLDGRKIHYLKLTKTGTTYRLEARQFDGFTGLLSPRVATRETDSIELIPRLAGLMLAPEYGVTGSVIVTPNDPKTVRVRLEAGKRVGSDRLVQANDVFAVSTITAKDHGETGQLKPYTYLRALGPVAEGEVRCEVISKYRQPLEERRGIAGFRCMKVASETAPLKLTIRDLDGKPFPASAPLEIWASDTFLATPTPRDEFEIRETVYVSKRPLPKIACVVVKFGATRRELFVLPIGRPGDPPAELRMRIETGDIAKAEFDHSCEDLTRRIAEMIDERDALFRELGKLINEGKNDIALQKATEGLKAAVAREKAVQQEIDALRSNPFGSQEVAARLLANCVKQMGQLLAYRPQLESKIVDLKDAVTKANDPVKFEREFRAKELARQIAYHTGRGEIPTALEIYDKLIELTQQADLPGKKAKLEAEWKPVDEAHAAARKVLLDEWRKAATQEEFAAVVPKLQAMVAEFAKHSDKHGLRNFLASLPTATARLGELVNGLDESIPANRDALQKIKQWNDEIRKADDAANAALK